jgi:hypothetical protein
MVSGDTNHGSRVSALVSVRIGGRVGVAVVRCLPTEAKRRRVATNHGVSLQTSLAGGTADFIYQKIVLGKSWGNINKASILASTFLGGRNIIASSLWESSGSFVSWTGNKGWQTHFDADGFNEFINNFKGNLFGNAWGEFFQFADPKLIQSLNKLQKESLNLPGEFFGNLISN